MIYQTMNNDQIRDISNAVFEDQKRPYLLCFEFLWHTD